MADMQEVLMQTHSFGIIPNFQGEVKVIKPGLLGHEWDEDLDNGFRSMRKSDENFHISGHRGL